MEDDDGPFWARMPRLQADPIRAPEPPGGFRRPRRPKAAIPRQRQRQQRAAQLRLAGIFRVGAVVMGGAVLLLAILVIVLIATKR